MQVNYSVIRHREMTGYVTTGFSGHRQNLVLNDQINPWNSIPNLLLFGWILIFSRHSGRGDSARRSEQEKKKQGWGRGWQRRNPPLPPPPPPVSLLIFFPFSPTSCHTPLSECLDQASGIQQVDPSWFHPGPGGGYFRNFFSLDQTQFK